MRIEFNRTGAERKALVTAIGEILEVKPKYKGMPSAAYEIDYFTVTKDGTLEFDDRADSGEIENLLERLADRGFAAETAQAWLEARNGELSEESENGPQEANVGLTVELPRESFTDSALDNLQKLVDSKAALMKKALAVAALPIEITGERVSFPWFSEADGESTKAYTHFITALCDMARNQKRITATEKAVDNEKYAFRCFLLRLGFIGAEYKTERKILLKNLTGNSAFKAKVAEETEETLRPEPINPEMRVDTQEHPDLTDEMLDEMLIQQVNDGFGGDSNEISE